MDIEVLTIFPTMFDLFWEHGIIRRAIAQAKIRAAAVDIRAYTQDRHQVTDDRPYGGGCGMVMKPEPLARAIAAARERSPQAVSVLMSPQGEPLTQARAAALAGARGLILVCGRYEGVDERLVESRIDYALSIGDYVLTGGELAAMVVMDAVVRLLPGVLGGATSADHDSFAEGLLEHPHYTRPQAFDGYAVPEVLLSGNHQAIDHWRRETALMQTLFRRPDLLEERPLEPLQIEILERWRSKLERILHQQGTHRADPSPRGRQDG